MGDARLFVGMLKEVKETVAAKSLLQQEREVLDNLIVAAIVIDTQGTIHCFNHAAEAFFGFKLVEVVGKNINNLMPSPFKEVNISINFGWNSISTLFGQSSTTCLSIQCQISFYFVPRLVMTLTNFTIVETHRVLAELRQDWSREDHRCWPRHCHSTQRRLAQTRPLVRHRETRWRQEILHWHSPRGQEQIDLSLVDPRKFVNRLM